MASPPSGTVTFLFTDIEGSTRLAQQHPDSMAGLLERHQAILKQAIEAHGGYIFQIIGDAFCAAFQTASEALDAALQAQCSLAAESWLPAPIRVRMGISTGSAQVKLADGGPPDYSGYVNLVRVQRVMSVAYGGQILLGNASAELLRGELPASVSLRDMGEHRLKSLLNPERLWQVLAPGLQAEFPPLKSLNAIPNNLPLQLTSFIGRQHEIEDVKMLLQTHRLVTLTGSGGTGKTRLALEIAAGMLDQFKDGVWLVELAPVRDGALIPQTVLHALGLLVESGRQPLEILTDYLAGKSLFILLDNCEHLLEESCSFLDPVLHSASGVKVLATSREALNLTGEQAYRVPSLAAPRANHLPSLTELAQFEAVHLFMERAALVSLGFHLTESNALALAQICERLDGIPLAIELAAARVQSMPLEVLTSRLDDRFRLLTGGSRNALPRQQTLRATIDWSYALLAERDKLLLQRLSVFRGGWTLEAAEAVCSGEGIEGIEVLDLLAKLVDKSLLTLDEAGRYQMLETVRQYAGEKLIDAGQAEWARDRHLHFMLELAERAEPEIRGHDQPLWLNRLEAELDNLRAALDWAQGRDADTFLRLASAIWRFWIVRVHYREDVERLEDALRRTEGSRTLARARALGRLAYLYTEDSFNINLAEQASRQAYDLSTELQDKPGMTLALETLGLARMFKQPGEAVSLMQQALKLARELGEHWFIATALWCLGDEAMFRNDLITATSFFEEARVEAHLSGETEVISDCLLLLDRVDRAQGNTAGAEKVVQEALSLAQSVGDRRRIAYCLLHLALVALFIEEYPHAEELLEEVLTLAEAISSTFLIASTLKIYGILELSKGNGTAVCEREQAALSLARQSNDPTFAAEAFSLLGEGHRLKGEIDLARLQCTKALVAARQKGFRGGYCYGLQGLGALALASSQTERAVRLFAARAKLRKTNFAEDYYPFMVREREKQIAEARLQLGVEAFSKAWAEGQAMSEEEMLAYVLEEPNPFKE